MRALTFSRFGGPEVLEWREVPDPAPQPGHAVVRTRAIGLNFADVYRRRGAYHLAGKPPYIAGYEAAGVVESAAPDTSLRPGQRVAFADVPFANAELVLAPRDKLVPLPDDVSFETAAASMLQGLTAQYLTADSHPLAAGEHAVVHSAAGGVGSLLTQICRIRGAVPLALVSSESKRATALQLGAEAALTYEPGWPDALRRLTPGGRGADVAFDGVGRTLMDSFAAVRTGGHVVFYGMAGGDPPHVDPRMLMDTSKRLSGGDLWNVLTSGEERVRRSAELFGWIRSGRLKVSIWGTFPLAKGAEAHRALEGRGTTGKILLVPENG
ncbi:MAG TPA: quinone oxidoreductase [Myxococcaceae bacterium]|nr:quinone oxidoreductase [Myxococcaceae bacterium]